LSVTGTVTGGNLATAGAITGASSSVTGIVTGASVVGGVITGTSSSVTGNVTGGNILTGGLFSATGNLTGGNILTGGLFSATGNITSAANVSGSYILGNGSQLTGIAASYGNANVAANLAAFGSNPISTTGNITAGNVSATGIAGTLGTAAQTSITSVGTLTALAVTGNITGGNISATGSILAVPAWTSAGAITFTATTTNPTKGTTTYDNISYRQLGAKQWEIILTYIQTVANGVSGSGDYLVTLPNSLSFDTTLPSQQITTTNIGTNTYALMSYIIPSGSGLINNDSLGGQVYPLVYNATKFRILTTSWGKAIQCWGSGYYALGGDDPKIQLTFRFTST